MEAKVNQCPVCKQVVTNQKYCSRECYKTARTLGITSRDYGGILIFCKQCDKPFKRKRQCTYTEFCSRQCYMKSKECIIQCTICNTDIRLTPSLKKKRNYCSECSKHGQPWLQIPFDKRTRIGEMYQSGESARVIARELKIAFKTVYVVLNQAGLRLRNPVIPDMSKTVICDIIPVKNVPESRSQKFYGIRLNLLPVKPAKMMKRDKDVTQVQHAMRSMKKPEIDLERQQIFSTIRREIRSGTSVAELMRKFSLSATQISEIIELELTEKIQQEHGDSG